MSACRRVASLLGLLLLGACGERDAAPRPLLVFGVDGGEWKAIERLWREGRLPALEGIAGAGSRSVLETFHGSSPVLWTTMATGLDPAEHGITDFVVPTDAGDRPLTSTVRKAPALWNMLSSAGRRVAVMGYWASWPAESVAGVMVSDRVRETALADRVYPPSFAAVADESYERALERRSFPLFDPGVGAEARDLAMAAAGLEVAGERPLPDLLFVYFRSVDVASHEDWADFESGRGGEDVARAYEAVDQAIGAIVAAAGGLGAVNVLVVSDHGFKSAPRPKTIVRLDFDRLLERLGLRDRAMTHGSPRHRPAKRIRFLGPALADELRAALATVRWANGEAAFRWREPTAAEAAEEVDAVAEVEADSAELPLRVGGAVWSESEVVIDRLSGRHDARTHGILLAAGPDVGTAAGDLASSRRPSVRDVAPTILYAVGLPYGRDFVGRPLAGLFTAEFRARHPLRAVSTWGRRAASGTVPSSADEKLVEELRALGYID